MFQGHLGLEFIDCEISCETLDGYHPDEFESRIFEYNVKAIRLSHA